MRFDKEKSCFVNDDGSKLKVTKSLVQYSNASYAKWCIDGLKGKEGTIVNNSHLWSYINGRHNNAGVKDWQGIKSKGELNTGRY